MCNDSKEYLQYKGKYGQKLCQKELKNMFIEDQKNNFQTCKRIIKSLSELPSCENYK